MHHPVGTLCGKGGLFQAKVTGQDPGVETLCIRKRTPELHRRIGQTTGPAEATRQ